MRGWCSSATENASFCRQPSGSARTSSIGGVLETEARRACASRALADLASLQVVDAAVEADVLADGEVFVEREALAHVADVALDRFARRVATSCPATVARPRRRRQQAGQHPDRRRLAGAVRAEKAEHLAGAHVEGDAVDGGEAAERARQIGASMASARVMRRALRLRGAPIRAMKRVLDRRRRVGSTVASANPRAAQKRPQLRGDRGPAARPRARRCSAASRRTDRRCARAGILAQREQRAIAVARANREQRPVERRGDRRRRVDREQASALNQRDAVAAVGFVHVRRRDEDRQPAAFEPAEQIPELAARHRVDAGRRLVEKQDLGTMHERAAERELLLHAARQRAGAAILERLELAVDRRDLRSYSRSTVVPNTDAKKRRFSSTLRSG